MDENFYRIKEAIHNQLWMDSGRRLEKKKRNLWLWCYWLFKFDLS